MMPNFIRYEAGARLRQEGFANNDAIPIADLSVDEAQEYAELMKQTFLIHWSNKVTDKGK